MLLFRYHHLAQKLSHPFPFSFAEQRRGEASGRWTQANSPAVATVHRASELGEVAEWSNAHDSKSCVPVRVPGVRIPPSPPERNFSIAGVLFFLRSRLQVS